MNLSNKLTLSRVIIIPFFVALVLAGNFSDDPRTLAWCRWGALLLFIAAAITDYYDGVLARRLNIVTNFGKLFDPLADKLLTMAAFVAFVELRVPPDRPILPAWAIILILGREYLVTGLRSIALSQGRLVHADSWGKHKTVWQLSGITVILLALSVRDTIAAWGGNVADLDAWLPYGFTAILTAVVVLTTASGIAFLVKNWDVISDRN